MKHLKVLVLAVVMILATVAFSEAMMPGGSGMFGGGFMMTNSGGFGMMNGMAGAPVVGDDGTAYLVTHNLTSTPLTVLDSGSFHSTIVAVSPAGGYVTFALDGIVSRPVVVGNTLVATASLPNFSNYMMFGPYSQNQSVLYAVSLPLAPDSQPVAVALDGHFASIPVIFNNIIYVTTTDFGGAMMGTTGTFGMFGNYSFNAGNSAKTYLYMFNTDGSLISKTEIQ